jgi:oligo-1,6-glucosidase
MRVNENYKEINVADQQQDKDSVLAFWQRLVKLRKTHKDIFVHGSYHVREFDNKQTWTYEKRGKHGNTAWIVLNFSEEEAKLELPSKHGKLVLSNLSASSSADRLKPFEGRIYLDT